MDGPRIMSRINVCYEIVLHQNRGKPERKDKLSNGFISVFRSSHTCIDSSRHSNAAAVSSFSLRQCLKASTHESEQNLWIWSEQSPGKEFLMSHGLSSFCFACCISWQPFTPEDVAPEQDVHVTSEGIAELPGVLVLVVEHDIMFGVAGSPESSFCPRRWVSGQSHEGEGNSQLKLIHNFMYFLLNPICHLCRSEKYKMFIIHSNSIGICPVPVMITKFNVFVSVKKHICTDTSLIKQVYEESSQFSSLSHPVTFLLICTFG